MAEWKKVPPELAERFDVALPSAVDVQRRQMFGCPCAFVNGNMFAGLHEENLIVRVPDEATKHPCVILGRTMKQYALFPNAVKLAPKVMQRWIESGYNFTRALPAKKPKLRRPPRNAFEATGVVARKSQRLGKPATTAKTSSAPGRKR